MVQKQLLSANKQARFLAFTDLFVTCINATRLNSISVLKTPLHTLKQSNCDLRACVRACVLACCCQAGLTLEMQIEANRRQQRADQSINQSISSLWVLLQVLGFFFRSLVLLLFRLLNVPCVFVFSSSSFFKVQRHKSSSTFRFGSLSCHNCGRANTSSTHSSLAC